MKKRQCGTSEARAYLDREAEISKEACIAQTRKITNTIKRSVDPSDQIRQAPFSSVLIALAAGAAVGYASPQHTSQRKTKTHEHPEEDIHEDGLLKQMQQRIRSLLSKESLVHLTKLASAAGSIWSQISTGISSGSPSATHHHYHSGGNGHHHANAKNQSIHPEDRIRDSRF